MKALPFLLELLGLGILIAAVVWGVYFLGVALSPLLQPGAVL